MIDFSRIGALLANAGRSVILNELLKGESRSVSDLARTARVAQSTASEHLAVLRGGGLVQVQVRGRHRLYSISRPQVAEALEALASISPATPIRTLRQSVTRRNLGFARTCYDHLAGKLGVAVHDTFVRQHWIRARGDGYVLTHTGTQALVKVGIDLDRAIRARRIFARPCLDWTEQRFHLAGALGAAITTSMFDRGWLRRTEPERSLELTLAGREGLAMMGVDIPSLSQPTS